MLNSPAILLKIKNAGASARALEILTGHMQAFVKEVGTMPSSKVFNKVAVQLKDPLLGAKLGYFNEISSYLERFLVDYQHDFPMTPFLYDDLFILVNSLLLYFISYVYIIFM